MFLDELSPFAQELLGHPVAFLGGLTSGLLRLSLTDEPVKGWLNQQGVMSAMGNSGFPSSSRNGNGPQTISID
jgi:hypothetical protein